MKIIIKEANKEKLTTAIKEAEGRASVRCITADRVIKAVDRITKHLDIPKKRMIGITAVVDVNAQDFPSAYRYMPESTQFTAEYTKSGWVMTSVCRDRTHSERHAVSLILTEEAKVAVLENASRMNTYEV